MISGTTERVVEHQNEYTQYTDEEITHNYLHVIHLHRHCLLTAHLQVKLATQITNQHVLTFNKAHGKRKCV